MKFKKVLTTTLFLLLCVNVTGCKTTSHVSQMSQENQGQFKTIEVLACDLSGKRESSVKVDVGYGSREYFAYTNEFAQLVKVQAKELVAQKEENNLQWKLSCKLHYVRKKR